jgi:hypothetical protein
MTRNVGRIDQVVRILIGFALIAYSVKDGVPGPTWLVAATFGTILIVTAFFSFCPLYTLLGWNTRHRHGSA